MNLKQNHYFHSEFLNQFQPRRISLYSWTFFSLWLTLPYKVGWSHTLVLFFNVILYTEVNNCLFFFVYFFKILLEANSHFSKKSGAVQVFATAWCFVMQLKDKYVFIFPTTQLYFCQRVVKEKRKIFVGKWVKNNGNCNRCRWYCSS